MSVEHTPLYLNLLFKQNIEMSFVAGKKMSLPERKTAERFVPRVPTYYLDFNTMYFTQTGRSEVRMTFHSRNGRL